MGARLSISACQRARAERTRHLGQTYSTGMIRPRLIGSAVLVTRAHAVERLVPAVVSQGPSASRRTTSQIIALLLRVSLSRSMLPPEALGTLKVRHISVATIQQTCA